MDATRTSSAAAAARLLGLAAGGITFVVALVAEICYRVSAAGATSVRRGPGGAGGAPGRFGKANRTGERASGQTSSLTLPDGTKWDRTAIGVKLEIGEATVTAPGYSATIKGVTSDAAQGLAAAGELAKAAAAIAAKVGTVAP